ncbi:calsequestrin-2-like [Ornithodoros turicata]|uniref:calsequestrin-2-like n=1 Tax=Ornithodoros turicata TaxID=34597 RepID=UPI003139FCAD
MNAFLLVTLLLAGGATAGFVKLLSVPKHDGTNRVCRLTSKSALEDAILTSPVLVVRVVEDVVETETGCLADDYFQVTAQFMMHREVQFCNILVDPIKEQHAAAVGDVYIYRNGKQFPYYGKRSAETLYGAIREATESQIKVITGKLDKSAFDQVQQAKVVGFFMKGSPEYAAYEDAWASIGASVPFYVVHDRLVAKHMKLNMVGQVAIYQPFVKQPVICPTNPASLPDILTFVKQHRRTGLNILDDYNLHDPEMNDYSRINLLAIAEVTTTKGAYMHRLLSRIMRNQSTVDLNLFNIVWIDPHHFPIVHAVMDQHGLTGKLPVFGTYNKTTGKKIWFDVDKLNMTGDKLADDENARLILEWMKLLAAGRPAPSRRWFSAVPASQTVAEGSDVILECAVEQPFGDCLWMKNGRNIGFSLNRLPHLSWKGNNLGGDCGLIIAGVKKGRDDGSWVCEVTGDSDHDTITSPAAQLIIEDAPKEEF